MEQQEVLEEHLLRHRPRPPVRETPGTDCLSCGDPIPKERLAVLPNACLCIDCQEDAERIVR
jgi:RNA polymerase-binding transcription factor DksA